MQPLNHLDLRQEIGLKETIDDARGTYNTNSQIRFKISILN